MSGKKLLSGKESSVDMMSSVIILKSSLKNLIAPHPDMSTRGGVPEVYYLIPGARRKRGYGRCSGNARLWRKESDVLCTVWGSYPRHLYSTGRIRCGAKPTSESV
jgi:hypothetical protein